ncbi:cytochrome P450 [Pseudomonas asuensis]|uniref:Cytochrome P450 n=1 Tax=Pseudomonas asuensis TaxID=1825787 RepID=A0ABQ2H2E6_9PSED|nr:cytochrome P450 [Pseudomonas asuensis]GGM29124.1 cytochrome P450 [Pseudomonas asuensis]
MDLLKAATHRDPYPFYSSLRAEGGLFYRNREALWIASDAASVAAVLAHPECRARPVDEPVPQTILESAAGEIFGHLMRMNEGTRHSCPRSLVMPLLKEHQQLPINDLATTFQRKVGSASTNISIAEWMFTFPIMVVARLLDIALDAARPLTDLTHDFVACLSPLSDNVQLQAAHQAAQALHETLKDHLPTLRKAGLIREPEASALIEEDVLVSNLVGLLSQTYEATAGLIGNCLVRLCQEEGLLSDLGLSQESRTCFVTEVLRHDPPVQNTRRFVARTCTIKGITLPAGSTVLVLLASANRDPELNTQPDEFLLDRPYRRFFSFGSGHHECPGQALAIAIADAALLALTQAIPACSLGRLHWVYRPSLNGRIPIFNFEEVKS